MKYPQLVSTPAVVKEWLEAELEGLGIDSTAYARTVLSVLTRDTTDPAEVIQSGYVIVANKFGRTGSVVPVSRQEELKRAEVIECLRSASEDQGGIQLLVDQLITMLKQLPHQQQERRAEPAAGPPEDGGEPSLPAGPEEAVLRYEAAFPALRRPTGGVISLTYFSRLSTAADTSAAAAAWDRPARRPPATAVWSSSFQQPISLFLRSSERDDPLDTLDTLPLRLRPGYEDAEAEPDLELELEPFAAMPQKPFEVQYQQVAAAEPEPSPRSIRPSTETHFQPIRRLSGGGGAEDAPPATYDARSYRRSDSGGLYLQDETDDTNAQRPQKYMIYQGDESSGRGLAPKFKLSSNEKCCQTDDDEEVATLTAERDLLQLLVSDEQTTQPRGGSSEAGEDDDSGYEVLSSLQATLNSIYEYGSDTAAESESESAAVPPRSSAFARVSRAPAADHRPLYLRGGGADSLLAAVYTDVAWRPDDAPAPETGHRPLYARQPAGAAPTAGYAQHSLLTSGRISGAVYQQGPTEYPALRYQLAGGGLPEVTFCQLANNTTSVAGSCKEDMDSMASDLLDGRTGGSRRNSAVWPATTGTGTSQWDTSDGTADVLLWKLDDDQPTRGNMVLWQVRDHSRDRSLDTSVWESDRELSEERAGAWEQQASSSERAERAVDKSWEVAPSSGENIVEINLAPSWELPTTSAADSLGDTAPWDSAGLESTADGSFWESRDEDVSVDDWQWDMSTSSRSDAGKKMLWTARPDGAGERTLWEAVQRERPPRLAETVWESVNSSAETTGRELDTSTEPALWTAPQTEPPADEPAPRWRSCAEMVEQQWNADAALWDMPESSGWSRGGKDEPTWERDDLVVQPQQWRKSDEEIAEREAKNQMRRLLLRLGGTGAFEDESNNNHGQGCSDDELASRQAAWEFIDENNVKNKVKLAAAEGECPLVEGVSAWHVLPALRQLSRCLSLEEGGALPEGVALKAWALEEQWRRDEPPRRPARERRNRKSDRRRPCAFFMEGNCKRTDCKFSHDLSKITCVFWEESGCFKGATCPFLHGYPPEDDEDDGESSDSAKRIVPKKTFKLEKEDFPSLHNTRKLRRTDDEDTRRPGRRGCRRHKSFSDAPLGGSAGGDLEIPRGPLGARGKRRRHHSKSEGVRLGDAGARRP